MPSPQPLRLAVVGAGLIGRSHIERIAQHPNCYLAAIVDLTCSARALAEQYGVPYFDSLQTLLRQDFVDGVILSTPNHLHLEQALTCLDAGVPTLIEKPVTATVKEALTLFEAERHAKASLLVGHHRAHSPIMLAARDIIAKGQLGPLVTVMGSAQFYKPDAYFAAAPWRTKPGGGPILINMIHEIHNLRMLCGEITHVQAFSSHKTRHHAVEDSVVMNFRFEQGALGTFVLSDSAASAKSWEQSSGENKSYASYPDEDCYHVVGTDGSLDIPSMRLKTYQGEKSWWKPFQQSQGELERSDPLMAQLEHFCDVILGNAQPLVSVYDGLQNLKVIEAIVEAAEKACSVVVGRE